MTEYTNSTSDTNIEIDKRRVEVIKGVVSILEEIIKESKTSNTSKSKINYIKIALVEEQKKLIFSANKIPKITLLDYLLRILKYSHIEESTLIIALIYVDRFCDKNNFFLTEYNVHRYAYY